MSIRELDLGQAAADCDGPLDSGVEDDRDVAEAGREHVAQPVTERAPPGQRELLAGEPDPRQRAVAALDREQVARRGIDHDARMREPGRDRQAHPGLAVVGDARAVGVERPRRRGGAVRVVGGRVGRVEHHG
jgi:hypothetical protein